MSSKIVRLTIANRYMLDGCLYHKTRAYKVSEATAEDLCMLEFQDMPVFKIVTESRLEGLEPPVSIIDMTKKDVKEQTPAPKKEKAAPKKKVSLNKKAVKKAVTDNDVNMV